MDVQELLKQLLSTALVLAVLGYVTRKVIEHWLSQRLDRHKTDLDHASERALETLRHELRIVEVQRSRLLARQASIVAGVFARLERLHEALRGLSAPILHKGEGGAIPLRDAAIERFNEFTTYYYERSIWLDLATCDQLNDLVDLLKKLLTQMDYNIDASGQVKDRARWIETYERLQIDVPRARQSLDKEFRALLGVVKPAARSE